MSIVKKAFQRREKNIRAHDGSRLREPSGGFARTQNRRNIFSAQLRAPKLLANLNQI